MRRIIHHFSFDSLNPIVIQPKNEAWEMVRDRIASHLYKARTFPLKWRLVIAATDNSMRVNCAQWIKKGFEQFNTPQRRARLVRDSIRAAALKGLQDGANVTV